jgi:hypothetical protein
LRRGWRVLLPNLEQCALLEIHYKHLEENCRFEKMWQEIPMLKDMTLGERMVLVAQVLDYFRRAYALHSEEYLARKAIDARNKAIRERLCEPWTVNTRESAKEPNYMRYETLKKRKKDGRFTESIGPNSALGKFLKDQARHHDITLKGQEYTDFIVALMSVLTNAGWLKESPAENAKGETTWLYRLCVDQLIWKLGGGIHVIADEVKTRTYKEGFEDRPNIYFQELYKTDFSLMKSLVGNEHTGQLENDDRKEREKNFRDGKDSVLFCSPTMELGIDIRNLNVVHMRNVPPTTSNYTQRGGRAGRRGQAALVFTSCSSYSPHDRHFFENQRDMVAGIVVPPKMDLHNPELLTAHLNAIYLAKAGLFELNTSMLDLFLPDNIDEPAVRPEVTEKLALTDAAKTEVKAVFNQVIQDIGRRLPGAVKWMNDEWITGTLDGAPGYFMAALDRWWRLYQAANHMLEKAQDTMRSGLYASGSREMRDAHRKERQALEQRYILTNQHRFGGFSEFYPYRYLASEGFLPGYNFPRLPYRTFIEIGDSGEYVSRRRFIALTEFGPATTIYHKGNKYRITQLMHSDIDEKLDKAKISANSGYFLMGNEYDANNCPFTGVSLTGGTSYEVLADLLPMTETRAVESERISCEEEDRIYRGYDVDTYFSVPHGMHSVRRAKVVSDGEPLLNLTFIRAARLYKVNRKWRSAREQGFLIGMRTGLWKKAPDKKQKPTEDGEETRRVMLYTSDTADALYIEPIKALSLEPDGVITLMYALKRAIENKFQVESREIDVTMIGDKKQPNIFIYESAEGSLGILSQFMDDKDVFRAMIDEAYTLCRFHEKSYKDEASYDDLLSYYNQRHHEQINRFEIEDALRRLRVCDVELTIPSTNDESFGYDERYQGILKTIDVNSEMEKRFIDYLYQNGLRLPDAAQRVIEDIYCRPDFYYEPEIYLFCDGSPHDDPDVQAIDREKRKAIRRRGGQVLVWHYKEKLEGFIAKRPDIFKRVR